MSMSTKVTTMQSACDNEEKINLSDLLCEPTIGLNILKELNEKDILAVELTGREVYPIRAISVEDRNLLSAINKMIQQSLEFRAERLNRNLVPNDSRFYSVRGNRIVCRSFAADY